MLPNEQKRSSSGLRSICKINRWLGCGVLGLCLLIGSVTAAGQDWQKPEQSSPSIEEPAAASPAENVIDLSVDSPAIDYEMQSPSVPVTEPIETKTPIPDRYIPDRGPRPKAVSKYNFFGGAPPIPGTRRVMADGEAPEDYVVEPGDTLFDIGAQLLDEPNYWPKLWSLNPEIPNPHFIYPGMHLRFYPGDDSSPPYLEIITEDDILPIDKDGLSEKELVVRDISGLLMKFAGPTQVDVIGPEDPVIGDFNHEFQGGTYDSSRLKVILPSLVFANDKDIVGRVVIGPGGESILSDGDLAVLEGKLQVGAAYLIMRPFGEVTSADGEEDVIGMRYDYIATTRVEKNLARAGQYMGSVNTNMLGAIPGDLLVTYRTVVKEVDSSRKPVAAAGKNRVVGFGKPFKLMAGSGEFVLLDKIHGDLQVGQTLFVYQPYSKSSLFYDVSETTNLGDAAAVIQVVDISSDVAIAYCLDSVKEIKIGDSVAESHTLLDLAGGEASEDSQQQEQGQQEQNQVQQQEVY